MYRTDYVDGSACCCGNRVGIILTPSAFLRNEIRQLLDTFQSSFDIGLYTGYSSNTRYSLTKQDQTIVKCFNLHPAHYKDFV